MEDFVVIVANDKYLKASETDEKLIEWTTEVDDAIWFNHKEEAEKFAKSRFSFGVNWKLSKIEYNIDDGQVIIEN